MTYTNLLRLVALVALASGSGSADAAESSSGPDAEASTLRVAEGFRLNRFADERLGVVKPTQIRFDGNGRLWVATTTSYPQVRPGERPDDRIVVLEDTDQDGVADRSRVFADGLHIPLGLELGDGGVYVGAADELLFLRDRDGDGRADERRVLLGGFGTGDTHQTLNTFVWGPSGELLMSQGLHAVSRIETVHGNVTLHQAGVWRFWPRTGRLEAFWDGAMGPHNPFGTVFDPTGRPLVFAGNGHGLYDLTPAMQPTDHFLLQAPVWSEGRKFAGADLADGPSWPDAHLGEYVAGGYLQNTVERFRIRPEGSTVKAERLPPLVESTNTAFRIVDVRFGPDGSLYLCDWYNPVIGHYQTSFRHPDRDKTHGRIWRIAGADAPTPGTPPRLEEASIPQLLDGLLSPARWTRLQCFRILRGRRWAEVEPALARWVSEAGSESGREGRRFEAAAILNAFDQVDPGFIEPMARSTNTLHRVRAARLCGLWAARLPNPLSALARLAADPDPQVRLEAVVACSRVPRAESVEVAAIATDLQMDPTLEYAFTQCVHATRPSWTEAQLAGRLRFDGNAARQSWFAKADRSEQSARVAAGRLARIQEVALEAPTQWALVEAVASGGTAKELGILLLPRTYNVGERHFPERHAATLRALAADRRHAGTPPDNAGALLGDLLESGSPAVQEAAALLVGHWRIAMLRERLLKRSTPGFPPAIRVAALQALGGFGPPESKSLYQEAVEDPDEEVAAAGIGGLARIDLDAAVVRFSERLSRPAGTPLTDLAFRTLLSQKGGAERLSATLRAAPLPGPTRTALRTALARSGRNEPALQAALQGVESAAGRHADLKSDGPVQHGFLEGVKTQGDPERGRSLFQRADLGCASCHGIGSATPGLGPDFSALGTAQTPSFILGALLEPQREVKEGFTGWMVVLKDGEIRQGRLIQQDGFQVDLFDAADRKERRFRRTEIEEARPIGSLMPEGLADVLDREELRDLIAYLSGLGRRR